MEKTPLVELKDIKKSFYGVPVLKGINMSLYEGECLSLIGENGAGKSTLIKILCGVYSRDSGTILFNGQEVNVENPDDAKKLGISVIYQELSLFADLTVYENIFIKDEITKGKGDVALLDIPEMKRVASEILNQKMGLDLDVRKKVESIPFSMRQMVEIGRAVYADSKVIVMDEPTTGLEDKEKKVLFDIIAELKKQGKIVIFISHHLDEIFANCDRTMVLRDGYVVLEKAISDLTMDELIGAMVGKSLDNYYPKVHYEPGDVLLEVEGLSHGKVFRDISLKLHKKEIIGVAGLTGCGKNEIIRALFGCYPYDKGEIRLHGKAIANKNVNEAMKNGFAFLPAERKVEGIFGVQSVAWNTTVADLDRINSRKGISLRKERDITLNYIDELKIKVNDPKNPIVNLSGGNQQKVILARWFLNNPEILLLEEPTRGIYVYAKTEVYRLIMDYVSKDKGVILVSSEEEELLGICDRIIVIHEGKEVANIRQEETSLDELKKIIKGNVVEEV